jgi:hypothetical protein
MFPYLSANGRKTFFSVGRCTALKQDADFDYLDARDSVVSGLFKNTLRRTGCRI